MPTTSTFQLKSIYEDVFVKVYTPYDRWVLLARGVSESTGACLPLRCVLSRRLWFPLGFISDGCCDRARSTLWQTWFCGMVVPQQVDTPRWVVWHYHSLGVWRYTEVGCVALPLSRDQQREEVISEAPRGAGKALRIIVIMRRYDLGDRTWYPHFLNYGTPGPEPKIVGKSHCFFSTVFFFSRIHRLWD